MQLTQLLKEMGGFVVGHQRKLAAQLGVSPATVCRDIKRLREEWSGWMGSVPHPKTQPAPNPFAVPLAEAAVTLEWMKSPDTEMSAPNREQPAAQSIPWEAPRALGVARTTTLGDAIRPAGCRRP